MWGFIHDSNQGEPLIYLWICMNTSCGWPTPVVERSKACVCGRSLSGNAGSNPTGVWISVSCECCVLSGRGLCDGLITFHLPRSRTECGVSECDREAFIKRRSWPTRRILRHDREQHSVVGLSESESAKFCNPLTPSVQRMDRVVLCYDNHYQEIILIFVYSYNDLTNHLQPSSPSTLQPPYLLSFHGWQRKGQSVRMAHTSKLWHLKCLL